MNIKQKALQYISRKGGQFCSVKQIAGMLPKSVSKGALCSALQELASQGKIYEKGRRYALSSALNCVKAEITGINGTFGFAKICEEETEEKKEVFIPGRDLLGAMKGDIVLLQITQKAQQGTSQSDTGRVLEILQANTAIFSGTVQLEKQNVFVLPDSFAKFPIFIGPDETAGAKDGDKVLAEIMHRGQRHSRHDGRIVKILGSANLAKTNCLALLEVNQIPLAFSSEVEQQANIIQQRGICAEDLQGRADLRQECIFTIDSADSKDLDDAVSIKKMHNGWCLGVHIADVSHYVKARSAIDNEAFARGTSIYYADSVIPMLPKALSNGICSLNPGEDRLAFSAVIMLDEDANIISFTFKKSVIRSAIKGVDSEINALFASSASADTEKKYEAVLPALMQMRALAQRLKKKHLRAGKLDLNSSESKIKVDAQGKAVSIIPRRQGESEEMIEEFMLTANEAAATLAKNQQLPFVFRAHQSPPADKVTALKELLAGIGVNTSGISQSPRPSELSAILKQYKGTPLESILNNQILRSMAKATYESQSIGHYGLVLENYCHFTSPIRRYPDLTIHRILSDFVQGEKAESLEKRYGSFVSKAAKQSTQREIAAVNIQRDCESFYKAEYMAGHIGQCFEGVISSVTTFGIYVELENTVEGLCRTQELPEDEYIFDGKITLTARYSGKKYTVGDKLYIKVLRADVSSGQIDFSIAGV